MAASSHCALVSTAGSLRGKGYGAQIDAHTHVIRLGQGPSGGAHQADVGARTTLRIVHCYMLRPNQRVDLGAFRRVLAREAWPPVAYVDCKCASSSFMKAALLPCLQRTRCFEPFRPTTGMQAVLHLLHESPSPHVRGWPRCDAVHLYGFGDRADPRAPYHYWSEPGAINHNVSAARWYEQNLWWHNFSREHRLLRTRLSADGANTTGPFRITRNEVARFCRLSTSARLAAWRAS